MMWPKTPDSLKDVFDRALPEDPLVERRKMFGFPSAFAGGNMFAGLHGDSLVVRLPEDQRSALLAIDGAHPFEPMAGRPMREYVVAPPQVADDPTALQEWLAKAFEYAMSLPPKASKKAKPKPKQR